jgi:hypothetical protein
VVHPCNPNSSGNRDQEDSSSKTAWGNSSARPYLEKPFTKIGLVKCLEVKAMSSSPSTEKKKKEGEVSIYLSIITLNVNRLNSLLKRHRLAEWIKKQDSPIS